ncbi:MAG: glycosyltransferase, partial [Tardiphaga sp.]
MALLDRGDDPEPVDEGLRSMALVRRRPHGARLHVPPDQPGNDNRPQDVDHAAPELACLRGVLPPDVLAAAARRARELDISAEQVLIHAGAIDEEAYLRRLAAQLGIRFTRLAARHDGGGVLGAAGIAQAAATGIVPLRANGALNFAIAPRRFGARGLAELAARSAPLDRRLQLTTTRCFNAFLTRHGGAALAERAAHGLRETSPLLSAAPPPAGRFWHKTRRALGIAAIAGLVVLPPLLADGVGTSLMAMAFLGFIGLRLLGTMVAPPPLPKRPRLLEAELPVYTLIIALYREASSVAPLMQAIDGLDYPREKLDVILVTEADDPATRAAIARLGPLPHLQMLVAPRTGPQTKPKALNYALTFARGSFVAVFDAEDRPEAGQLRAALAAFAAHTPDVACV